MMNLNFSGTNPYTWVKVELADKLHFRIVVWEKKLIWERRWKELSDVDLEELHCILINILAFSCQAHPNPSSNYSERVLKFLHIPNIMVNDVPNKPLDYYTCPFKKSKLDR